MITCQADSTGPPSVERLYGIATTQERLEDLLTEIVNRRLPVECYDLVRYLASMTPFQRLNYNIKTTVWLLGHRLRCAHTAGEDLSRLNILIDALTYEERQTLMAVDGSGASLEARRTAHSLLDLDVRQRLVETLGGAFKDRWERRRHRLIGRPLDETVSIERYK